MISGIVTYNRPFMLDIRVLWLLIYRNNYISKLLISQKQEIYIYLDLDVLLKLLCRKGSKHICNRSILMEDHIISHKMGYGLP